MATKKNNRNTKKQQKRGKSLRINGEQYWLIKRADGRYNIYKDGHQGAAGSTPLTSARDFSEARKKLKDLALEFEQIEQSQVPADVDIITLDDYENSTEDLVPVSQYDIDVYEEKPARQPSRMGARATLLGRRIGDKATDKVISIGDNQYNKGIKRIQKALGEVAAEGGVVGKAAGFTNRKVGKLAAKQNAKFRSDQAEIKSQTNSLRESRLAEARRQNEEALRNAKAAGYKQLADEKAALQIRLDAAKANGDAAELSRVNQEMEALNRRKAEFDKSIPQGFKFPYNLPNTKGKHSSQKRAQRRVERQIEVDEILALRGSRPPRRRRRRARNS